MNEELISSIFQLVIIPLLVALTGYAVSYIKLKSGEVKQRITNETTKKYVTMLEDTICSCVLATTQTYTEALKKEGKFDKAAQEEAFKRTYENVLAILTVEAKDYLTTIYGDLNAYLTERIESQILINK